MKNNLIRTPVFFVLIMLLNAATFNVLAETVNINKADAMALEQNLSGIGPVKAKAIVDYRKKHGAFKRAEDIQKVPGVGEELYKRNRNDLSTTRGLTRATERSNKRSALNDPNKTSPADRNADKSKSKAKESVKDKKGKKDKKSKKDKKDKKSKKDSKKSKNEKSKKNTKSKKDKGE